MRDLHDAPSSQPATGQSGGLKVLLAAEPGDFATRLRLRLEQGRCTVDVAVPTGDVALKAQEPYDVILVDLETDDLLGLSLLRDLKSTAASVHCPVVLMKGEDQPHHTVQRGLDLGAAGYIVKGRLPAELSTAALFDALGMGSPRAASKRPSALRLKGEALDACPFSARGTFHDCAAFMPIDALVHADAGLEPVSCSHLRAGEAHGWQRYPRCAIGGPASRAKYAREQTC